MACPDGKMRGPGNQPASIARMSDTSSSRPPVCTKMPRLRTVVNPASNVLRHAGTARSSFIAGSSCTALMCVEPAPPMRKLSSMSMSPGSSVTSPSSIDLRVVGDALGPHVADPLALDDHHAGLDDARAPPTSTMRSAFSTTGSDGGFGRSPA